MQYVGVDHHKRFSYLTVMDEKGNIVKEGKINNTRESLNKFLNNPHSKKPAQAVLEAGRNWTVMYDWLEEELDSVKLAHPLKVKAIAEAKIKKDKIDAKTLAHLLRSNLIPEAYVPNKSIRKVKNILRQRMFFVKLQTMVKNRIHMILDRYPELRGQIDPLDLFGKQGREWLKQIALPKEDRKLLDAEIGDISRFRQKNKLCSYAGLIPTTFASGGKVFHGRITKQGNKYLRWAAIEAIWPAIRKDLSLRMYYQKAKLRKGSNPAKVATARRLLIIIYRVLSQNRPYIVNYLGRPHKTLAEVTK